MIEGSGEHAAPLERGHLAGEVWGQLWPNLPGLLAANLLFLLWCAPGVLLAMLRLPYAALVVAPLTAGPGLAGLMTYAARLARGEPARFWRDSMRGTRGGFVAGSAHTAVVVLAWQAHGLAFGAVVDREADWGAVAMWAGQVGVLALLAIVEVHVFSLIGLYRQGALEAARNALVLAARCPEAAVAMLGLGAAAWGLSWALVGGPLIILPAAMSVCAVNNTLRLVREVSA